MKQQLNLVRIIEFTKMQTSRTLKNLKRSHYSGRSELSKKYKYTYIKSSQRVHKLPYETTNKTRRNFCYRCLDDFPHNNGFPDLGKSRYSLGLRTYSQTNRRHRFKVESTRDNPCIQFRLFNSLIIVKIIGEKKSIALFQHTWGRYSYYAIIT